MAVAGSGVLPLIDSGSASAAQVTVRSLTIGTAQISTATSYKFGFTLATTAAVQGLKFQACTTALGTCTAPTGFSDSSATYSSQSGWGQAVNFAKDNTGANDCVASASIMCANRTAATAENASTAVTITFNSVTNPSGASCSTINCTFFERLTTYSTNTYTAGGIVDTGTVASSTTQTLTVNATIQETLTFCVGATTVDNGTSAPPACASVTGTSVNLGTLDSGHINVTPVSSTVNGDGNNGVAELSTNAANGATVTYDAIQQSGTNHQGTLRVSGASCNSGNVNTDQCIDAAGTSEIHIVTGTEKYGMTIAAVNCVNTTAYSCTFAGGTYHLTRNANYNGTGSNTYPTDTGQITGTSNAFYAWDETGTTQTIAASSSPNGAVDSEALILKFAATPNLVTPTGSYTAKADFVATPTY